MFALAVTDLRWHAQMLSEPPMGLVNFWTPTRWRVKLKPGVRWGFMLKSPVRKVGGFGTLVAYEETTVEEAWERWGLANGVDSLDDFQTRITGFANRRSSAPIIGANPVIGCVLLEGCVFLPPDSQLPESDLGVHFPSQVVKWKGFKGDLRLAFENSLPDPQTPFQLVTSGDEGWETKRRKKRLAQGLFRKQVLAAYGGVCAATGTACEEVIEAAHIQPFISLASNHIQNGIALRRDVHCLFDAGLITIRHDLTIQVSSLLTASPYLQLEGVKLRSATPVKAAPSPEAIGYHRREVFRA